MVVGGHRKDISQMIRQLTYLGPTLIVAGLAKNYFYYRAFNIRILDYIELSETLSIITEFSIFILILIPISWFVHFMLDLKKEHITEPEKNKDLVEIAHEKKHFFKRLGIYLLRYWGATLTAIILFVLSLFAMHFDAKEGWILWTTTILMLSMVTYILLILEFRYKYKCIFERELDEAVGTILHYSGLFIILMTFYTYIEIRGTKTGVIEVKNYFIELNTGEKIQTTKDLIAIGQTRNYFFIYDRTSEQTTMMRKDLINRITTK